MLNEMKYTETKSVIRQRELKPDFCIEFSNLDFSYEKHIHWMVKATVQRSAGSLWPNTYKIQK